jgi:hypothetical protein
MIRRPSRLLKLKENDDEPEPELPVLRTQGMWLREQDPSGRGMLLREDVPVQPLQVRTGVWLSGNPEEVTRSWSSRKR